MERGILINTNTLGGLLFSVRGVPHCVISLDFGLCLVFDITDCWVFAPFVCLIGLSLCMLSDKPIGLGFGALPVGLWLRLMFWVLFTCLGFNNHLCFYIQILYDYSDRRQGKAKLGIAVFNGYVSMLLRLLGRWWCWDVVAKDETHSVMPKKKEISREHCVP